jgi:carbamoyl-phosphate synthase small subunit
LIIKEQSRIHSNWQAEDSFPHLLEKQGIVAIGEIDTRTLAVKIRNEGQMWGILSTEEGPKGELLRRLKDQKGKVKNDFISQISVDRIFEFKGDASGPRVAILDLGITNGFLEQLKHLGCHMLLLPYNTDVEEILGWNPDGLLLSNGPEEDEAIPQIVETIRRLLGQIPLWGISTGHQIICLALGGSRKKMKLGHHGANYPVISPSSLKGDITFQNHSWAVDEESLAGRGDIAISLRNLNDQSIEEIESRSLRILSTQYYPISPGFDEVNPAFMRFLAMMKER